ncbi:hypothetical protein NY78_2293 [Desulfovibrio sp. TomC]|nr:hypothetical protein NY78_2293 [Desulfovibrio sp. TomC]
MAAILLGQPCCNMRATGWEGRRAKDRAWSGGRVEGPCFFRRTGHAA